jgi:hypothetical protein
MRQVAAAEASHQAIARGKSLTSEAGVGGSAAVGCVALYGGER